MGCTASKLENEDTVRRCKERRRLMKEAVYARHHLAAAHSDYCRSLRLTGSALSTFAAGEPLSVSNNTPAVFLHAKPATTTTTTPSPPPPPPPPPRPFNPSPSPTITSSKLPPILSSSSNHHHRRRKPPPPKLPHILSDSSPSSTPRSHSSNFPSNFFPTAHSTYSSTPSQTSSVWNWENFYPPPPPPASDHFPEPEPEPEPQTPSQFSYKTRKSHKTNNTHEPDGFESERSEYDYFNGKLSTFQNQTHHLPEEYTETEREEVQCSEWGDHYSSTASSDDDDDDDDDDDHDDDDDGVEGDVESRSEIGTRTNFGSSVRAESVAGDPVKGFSVGKSEDAASSEVMEMKMVVRHKDLKEIVEAIRDNFDKAAMAGDEVSDMLEISKAQLDRSFRQLRSMFLFMFVSLF